jgi:ferritin-like metal-binding protein YciE
MTTPRESLAAWLRDAHAMEGQAETFLQTQIDRLENYPEALPRLGHLNAQGQRHEGGSEPAGHDARHGE